MNKATIALSVITSAIVIAVICVVALNWSAIKTMLAGGKLYTIDDINTAYEEGKQDYAKINAKYDELLKEYQEKSMQVIELTEKVTTLENENKQIPELKKQIEELQAKVKELQNKVKYYEELLSAYENVNKLIATFMYDDEVYLVQLYESGSKVSIQAPQSTTYKVFNGWKVNDEIVDLETYTITDNTTFVADITYKYDVTFMVDNNVYVNQIIVKGGNPTYPTQPTKSGYKFKGWSLNGVDTVYSLFDIKVTGNITITALFVKTLENSTWAEIAEISASGQAEKVFDIGDEKTIKLSTGEELTFCIMGFNHDELSDGSGKAGITLGMKNLYYYTYAMNNGVSNVGGWNASIMRTQRMNELFSLLPEDLQKIIKTVNKKSSAGNQSSEIITTTDKLWLFSLVEVTGTTDAVYVDEGTQYAYYKRGNSTIKYLNNGSGVRSNWATRSATTSNNIGFEKIDLLSGDLTSNRNGVCFGMCI